MANYRERARIPETESLVLKTIELIMNYYVHSPENLDSLNSALLEFTRQAENGLPENAYSEINSETLLLAFMKLGASDPGKSPENINLLVDMIQELQNKARNEYARKLEEQRQMMTQEEEAGEQWANIISVLEFIIGFTMCLIMALLAFHDTL